MNLLNGDDSDDENVLKINENYAQRYDKWRGNEELQKLKDKYGENYEEETSSTSEEEDEDAVELTEEVEKDFFKTLSCLKEKNPKIYDEKVRFFKERAESYIEGKNVKKKPEETLTMAAYHRKMLMETNGILEEEDPQKLEKLPLVEQEKALKESFKAALRDSESDEEEGVGGLFKPRVQSQEEKEKEEADYRQWLVGQTGQVPDEEKEDLKGLRDYWADPQLDDGEKFLRDYILNHRYLEKGDEKGAEHFISDSEEETMEKQEEFERKFNFRFEEPDQDFIKRYPRTVEQSMRKKDDRRKKQREELKARKNAERAQKDEELKRLKALKRAEIMEKIKKLQEVTGNDDMTFQEQDLEGEFNGEEHDKRMSQLFNEEFYDTNVDDEKPEFPELDEELEIEKWDEWSGRNDDGVPEENLHCEDPDFVMDCDYDPKAATQQELLESTRRKRKRRQSKFAQAVSRPKPVFDPTDSKFEQYLDEYYALNYEDLIGDIPCRFKYRKVVPNDFGLSVEEILAAPDKELNRWASVKKIMRRRPEHVELYEVKAYRNKAKNMAKKTQCLPSIYAPPVENEENVDEASTNGLPTAMNTKNVEVPDRLKSSQTEEKQFVEKQLKKKKKKTIAVINNKGNIENSSQVSSKKGENKEKKQKRGFSEILNEDPLIPQNEEINSAPAKKRKKKKEKNNSVHVLQSSPEGADKSFKTDLTSNEASISPKDKNKVRKKPNKGGLILQTQKKEKSKVRKWKHKKQNRPESQAKDNPFAALSDARLKSYGINPKKFKNKLKYGKK